MTWDPTKVDARIINDLVITNATLEGLNEPLILTTSTVVKAHSIVNDATVCVDVNITFVVISAAKFNAHTDRNSFTNIVGGTPDSSTIRMDMLAVIISVVDDNTRARRAGVWLRRTVSENISGVDGQTLEVSRNHLSGRSFLLGGACRAANVCLESELVTRMNNIVGIVSIKKIRVKLADTRETVIDHPVTPAVIFFAVASLRPPPPNRVDKHSTKGSGVRRDVGFGAEKMIEVIRRRSWENQLSVHISDSTKHRRAVTENMGSGIAVVRAEPAPKVGPVSASISEHHVVGKSNNVEPCIGRDPGRGPSLIAEKVGCVCR